MKLIRPIRLLHSILMICTMMLAGCIGPHHGRAARENPLAGMARLKDYRAARVSSESREDNLDFRAIGPGETFELANLQGPGEITHLWTTISTADTAYLTNLVLRIHWDDNPFPSVESPIGDFFGLGMGKYYVFENTVQAIGSDRGLNCFWPMPFSRSARITVTNESDIPVGAFYYYVDWRRLKHFPPDAAYFHAQYRQAFPAPDRQRYTILETAGGRGHYVGVSLSIHTQVGGWWGEGDDVFTVDGEEQPSLWGTGSEDYFCGAWCYHTTFYNDYFGMPLRERLDHAPNNFWNVYRHHIENPIPFDRSLKVEIEHGGDGVSNTRHGGVNNDYSSVAYWYMEKPVALVGELPPAPARYSAFRSPEPGPEIVELQYAPLDAPPGTRIGDQEMGIFENGPFAWLNSDQLFMNANPAAGPIAIRFKLEEPRGGPLFLHLTQAGDYGTIRILLDGQVIVPEFNGYHDGVRPVLLECAAVELDAGEHALTVEAIGQDEKSTGACWGIDYLRIGGKPHPCEKFSIKLKATD